MCIIDRMKHNTVHECNMEKEKKKRRQNYEKKKRVKYLYGFTESL